MRMEKKSSCIGAVEVVDGTQTSLASPPSLAPVPPFFHLVFTHFFHRLPRPPRPLKTQVAA